LQADYLCVPLEKIADSSSKKREYFFECLKKNFAEIKRPLTFAPRSKKSGGSKAERSLKVWKQ
jgi:hypothetical protein